MREIVLSVGKQSPVPNSRPELRWLLRQVVEIVEDLCTAISDPYRPERHYMCGPGTGHGVPPNLATGIDA